MRWGGTSVLLHEGVHEEALHGVEVGDGLLVAAGGVGADGGEFEAVEGALAGQGLALVLGPDALLALRIVLADQDGQQRVVAKAVVVDEVFVAQAEAEDALLEQIGEGVLDEVGIAVVGEAAGELVDEVELGFDLAQEQAAGVGGDGVRRRSGQSRRGCPGAER